MRDALPSEIRMTPDEPSGVPEPATIYLIRHGETEWSLNGRHTGRTDVPLTVHGENEARALAPRLSKVTFEKVFVSPRQRALRTCALAGLDTDAEIEADLSEWDYGDDEGRLSTDIRERRPGWNLYRDGCPGGEEPADVSARADRVIERLRARGGQIAVFSHGQFGCCLAARWIGLPVFEARHFQLGPASISILAFDPHHPGVPVIARWNVPPDWAGPVRHSTD